MKQSCWNLSNFTLSHIKSLGFPETKSLTLHFILRLRNLLFLPWISRANNSFKLAIHKK
jgi:hypothetical protein